MTVHSFIVFTVKVLIKCFNRETRFDLGLNLIFNYSKDFVVIKCNDLTL